MSDVTWTPTTIPLRALTPWERNPKRISKTHAARLLDLWQRLGQFQTIAIGPAGEVYDGHQRLSVLKAAHGGKYEVQALQSSRALTEKEREELTVAAHVGTTGQFDWDALSGWDVGDLQSWGFDTETLANWQTDIGALRTMLDAEQAPTGDDPGAQVDKASELQAKWGISTGQLWALGEHRLICGDCTDAAVVARVMDGEKADTIITDPPYNVDKAIWDTDILPMLGAAASVLPDFLTQDGICFWFTATRYIPHVIDATSALPYRWMFIWYPSNNMAHGDLGFQKFTAALVLGREKVWRENMQDLRDFPIRITKDDPGHPTPKPIELIEYLVSMASMEIVFDGFLGSGTTLIACERLARRCRAIEISPAYCAVAIERWHVMTGRTPVLLDGDNG